MANRNTQGFGLIPAGTLGQTPATSGQGQIQNRCGLCNYHFSKWCCSFSAGYIIDGQTTDAPILGVLNGIFYNAADNFNKPTFSNLLQSSTITPANSQKTSTAFVMDDNHSTAVRGCSGRIQQAVIWTFLETYDMNASAGDVQLLVNHQSTLDIGDYIR